MSAIDRVPLVLLLAAAAPIATVGAQTGSELSPPAAWAHPDGTTHWYRAVTTPLGITWDDAHRAAAAAGGHLVTIASSAENDVVYSVIDRSGFWTRDPATTNWLGPWIGGVQRPGAAEPAGGWSWQEFEPFGYAGWATGQPDDVGRADRICFGGDPAGRSSRWADEHRSTRLPGYVIEYGGSSTLRTIGLLTQEAGSDIGYTLLAPIAGGTTWLVDSRGRKVHEWTSPVPQFGGAYLQSNGDLVSIGRIPNARFAIGGVSGRVDRLDWNGTPAWQLVLSSSTACLHHDVEILPNGNLLVIAWELKTSAAAIAAGRDPALLLDGELWPDAILEIQPSGSNGGNVVWEWHAWDHLIQDFDPSQANHGVVAQHPELIDLNYRLNFEDGRADWMHTNAIDYDADLDQILISVRHFDEVWIIDHSTTTQEAAGHRGGRSGRGGDLLYRWGNPFAYRAGTRQDQQLFQQHDAHWIADGLPGAGNILCFNNGRGRPTGDSSSVDEIVPPTPDAAGNYPMVGGVFGPVRPTWTHRATPATDFFSIFVSGAQRLASGNTLICSGWVGDVFEVTRQGQTVWRYEMPATSTGVLTQGDDPELEANRLFRAPRLALDDPAFRGRPMTPDDPIERHPIGLLADGSTLQRDVAHGATVELSLRAAGYASAPYLVVTTVAAGLQAIDERFLRVGSDLLSMQLPVVNPVFQRYLGHLDPHGRGTATIAVPPLPMLVGITLHSAFLVAEPTAPTGIGVISNTAIVHVDR